MNSRTHKWNSDAAKAQVKERQDQVSAAIKKVSNAKHAPRPWEVKAFHGSQHSRYEVHDTLGNDIVFVDYEIGDEDAGLPTNEQREANAHLIAAAPELLEALEAARDCILQFAPIKAHEQHAAGWDVDSLVDTIESAIAKARGEK